MTHHKPWYTFHSLPFSMVFWGMACSRHFVTYKFAARHLVAQILCLPQSIQLLHSCTVITTIIKTIDDESQAHYNPS